MLLKKLILAFILGLILFLAWGHPANATTIVRPPVRPLIVNPNITGGTLAPTTRAPLVPAPVPGAGAYPVPFILPLQEPETPNNPFICPLQIMAISYVYRDYAQYRYDQYGFDSFGASPVHLPVGEVPPNFSPSKFLAAYRKSSMYSPQFEYQIWGLSPGTKYAYSYKEIFYTYTNWQGTQRFYDRAELSHYVNGVYRYNTSGLFPFELVPVDVPVDSDCLPEEEEENQCPSALDCLLKIFSNKFPFDVFYAVPDDRGHTCPLFTFLGKDFDLCWLYELVSFARYPIVLSLVIKTVLHL